LAFAAATASSRTFVRLWWRSAAEVSCSRLAARSRCTVCSSSAARPASARLADPEPDRDTQPLRLFLLLEVAGPRYQSSGQSGEGRQTAAGLVHQPAKVLPLELHRRFDVTRPDSADGMKQGPA